VSEGVLTENSAETPETASVKKRATETNVEYIVEAEEVSRGLERESGAVVGDGAKGMNSNGNMSPPK
jgi:hypothetical protein